MSRFQDHCAEFGAFKNMWFVKLAEPPNSSIASFELPIGLTVEQVRAEILSRWPDALGFRSSTLEPWTEI